MKTSISSLKEALLFGLNGLYDAEKKIEKFLNRVEGSIKSQDLRHEVAGYAASGAVRLNKLKWAFEYLVEERHRRNNKVVDAMTEELDLLAEEVHSESVRDAMIVCCVQQICHYKMAVYGTCMAFAHELRLHDTEEICREILESEKNMDKRLTELAVSQINDDALAEELR
ncbi:MAG TPA: DUF892 family protein [Chryseosolibacter sp.]|nr:DUF892 family protein [Chryseosolibacter sp.]